jgi:hypothetical protein
MFQYETQKDSLRDLMTTGKGQPNPIEEIVAVAREMSREL